ncbi:6-pyruvoyl trahydropterin synthase family protein [Vreelandella malpeensis]|uniref:6-carboxy-5,6,7,8-tetrahydropterin synthase n=1 Tax=Vreelandella malpeensis TaxID=1172368 RepID=A0ABS8DW07_9GAMM|nr:6-carboxytetrahydropterin synthase [Halomonas malpeensis]MCB8890384.1 6-carboxytetrahydropterin synthase [Halomonas malpeensis]
MALFVKQLSHIDVSLWCQERGLVGMSWQVDATLEGELGEDGMLFDFGLVKPFIKKTLDAGVDHTLLVPTRAPGVHVEACPEGLCVRTTTPYAMEVRGPEAAFTLIDADTVEPEVLAATLGEELTRRCPENVGRVRLALSEEVIDGAAYGYSHGLKRHQGNCQRIAHGHRSRLEIYQGGARVPALEARWARWLDQRYLLERADITAEDDERLTCRYVAGEGAFAITLPRERCAVLPWPTTVENIARWLAEEVAGETATPTRVYAYEGFNKGATAESELE